MSISKFAGTLMFLTVAAAVPQMAFGQYVLGGLTGSITGESDYGWDEDYETAFRTALQTASNFGAGGTVTTAVTTVNVSSTASFAGIKGLVVPWWANSSASTTQVNQVNAFFRAGGDLLIAQDDSAHDPMGIALGLPVAGSASSPWTPAGYLAAGPFGPITSVNSFYYISDLSPTTVSSLGGTVGATDGSGNVTVAYWPKGAFCSTCGALIITGDVDVWSTSGGPGQVQFSPLNANGQFSLNLVAYMIQNSGNFTGGGGTPLSTTPAPATIWLTLAGLITAAFYVSYRNRKAAI